MRFTMRLHSTRRTSEEEERKKRYRQLPIRLQYKISVHGVSSKLQYNYRTTSYPRREKRLKAALPSSGSRPRHLFKHIYSPANTIRSFSPRLSSFFLSRFPRERFSPIFQCPLHLLSFMSSLFLSRATSINTQATQ